jgi:TetR/AcrR family transcriptional regulator of autoinduction and epiphytic fitness
VARNVKPRRYDSSNRHRQAAETQARILDAAQMLFIRDGYTTTTMTAIADQAGVAVQTVYASSKSKRDILKGIIDRAVIGSNEQVAVVASSRWLEIEREPDPRTTLRMFVRLHREICEREAPAFSVMTDAAGSDRQIRTLLHQSAERRYQDQLRLAQSLHQGGHIHNELSTARAADIIWTLASERTYLALVRDRGWSARDYEDWLADQLIAALLPTSP